MSKHWLQCWIYYSVVFGCQVNAVGCQNILPRESVWENKYVPKSNSFLKHIADRLSLMNDLQHRIAIISAVIIRKGPFLHKKNIPSFLKLTLRMPLYCGFWQNRQNCQNIVKRSVASLILPLYPQKKVTQPVLICQHLMWASKRCFWVQHVREWRRRLLALPLCTCEGRSTHKSGQEKDACKEVAINQ